MTSQVMRPADPFGGPVPVFVAGVMFGLDTVTRVRDQVELPMLAADLDTTVRHAIAPSMVSL